MNILITGANGFIGKSLTKAFLERGDVVYAIVTSKEEMKDISCSNLFVHELFFEDYKKISELVKEPIDIAYHFAWAGLCGAPAQDVELQVSNIVATSTLIEELAKLHTKKVVFASTMNMLELRSLIANPTKVAPRGVSIHVSSKLNADIIARTLCHKYGIMFNDGLIAMAYGKNNKSKMIPNVIMYSLINNKEINLVEGNNLYDMVYISDIVSAFIAIGEKGKNSQSYYIGHDDKRTFKDIICAIRDILNKDQQLNFGVYKEDNNLDYSLVDRSLLTKDTGWKPEADFKESILRTAKWIKESGMKF